MERNNNILPSHWQIMKLGEVCTYSKGKKPAVLKVTKTKECSIPYINIKAFEKGIISEYTNGEKCNICNDDDLLMVWDGARCGLIGKAKKGAVGSTLMKILPKENIHKEFLYHFISSKFWTLNTKPKGVGIPHIEPTLLWNFELIVPPLPEQQAIVAKIEELLSELDNGKQQLLTAQQQLKVYRQSLLNLLANGKNLKTIDSVIEKLDQGWSPKCLNENSKDENEWAVIKTSAVQHGHFVAYENKILPKDLKPREQHELKAGDILITRAGPRIRVGVCCLVRKTRPRLINCDKVYRIKVNTKIISPEYFELILNTPFYQREIEKMKSGISDSGLNLTQSKFLKVEIPVPNIKEQKLIVSELESKLTVCDKIEETISQSLQQAETLRQSILKQAFEGKLVSVVAEQREAKVIPLYKPKSEYFYQMQLLGLVAKTSKQKQIEHGEMTLAKYAYLMDKAYDIPTYFNYNRWHLGPYPPTIKKVINNKQYFKKSGNHIEVLNEKTLLNSTHPYTEKMQSAVNDLTDIFSKYSTKERSHKTELLATICKVIEDIQSTYLKAVRLSMQEWKINLKGEKHKTKAEKFNEAETEKCLAFIKEKGWDKKLMK
ncbi:restriction endonuclease subunit S [Algoriphagus persicinus]|uniref:restriction endonuclease subunit S n=1 Tax=Algoriphagus persicinus TaxID=3108754 RepID=UPI002B3A98BE|nr:restriction endonuclease subunit S [Algoriphagus sp. E1-3-M2]MEB2787158.1 restriction endonuclease subunit S [Algoriphagus sp. E1-3-M2]